ncbi:MAG TPA: putative toxin-antitoxin system toxin component, PIN family [bacterium]|nr:putative toxin-antitoxin system toxin component, PIN family [bacterium]
MKKKLKVVIDTNIFISSLLGGRTVKSISQYFEERKFVLILSEFIIKEIKEVLTSKELGNISIRDVEDLFKTIDINAEFVKPSIKVDICRDLEDNKILETALEGKADFIVSGDKDLLSLKSFHKIPIVSFKEFLKCLKK